MSEVDQERGVPPLGSVVKLLAVSASPTAARDRAAEESEALSALQRGDKDAALSHMMELYEKPVYRYCCHMVRDRELAEDLLQTVFLQAYMGLERFQRRSSLWTWLMGIARHRCLDAIKARRRWGRTFESGEVPNHSSSSSIEEPHSKLVLLRALETCLAKLEDKVRDAVVLRYVEGLAYPEMEDLCNEKAATLQMRVARALPVLRRCLEAGGAKL